MRRLLPLVLLPLTLLLDGCCDWSDDEELPYHALRVNNLTDKVVNIRSTAVTHVLLGTDCDGDTTYSFQTSKRSDDIAPGGQLDLRVPRESEISIKADYGHNIHWYEWETDASRSCSETIDIHSGDFITPIPVASG